MMVGFNRAASVSFYLAEIYCLKSSLNDIFKEGGYNCFLLFCCCLYELFHLLCRRRIDVVQIDNFTVWWIKVHYCVFSQQDNRHVRGLLHWWAAVLFSIRPDWLLQLCVLPAKRGETAIASGAPRGETDSMAGTIYSRFQKLGFKCQFQHIWNFAAFFYNFIF